MNEQRIEGAAKGLNGGAQRFLGGLTGDRGAQVQGQLKQAQGKVMDYYGRAVDALERQVDRAPETLRPQARQAVSVARARPIATMLGLAAVGLLLTRGNRRRR